MLPLLKSIHMLFIHAVAFINYLGAFSRLTSGRYTPGFYSYQLDRAPNDDSTRLVPVVDITLATLTLIPGTRIYGLLGSVLLYYVGIFVRLMAHKDATKDIALGALGLLATWTYFAGW